MNYNSLRTAIAAAIKSPADPKISGSVLQQQLIGIVNALDLGALYLGMAGPNTTPNAEANGFYFATQAGTYTNFLNSGATAITVSNGEIALLVRSGNAWAKEHMMTMPYIDPTTKHWIVDGLDSGVVAEGQEGQEGQNAYVYIMYAASLPTADADMHSTPQAGDKWIGVYSGNLKETPTTYNSYVWSKYVGDDGINGQPGTPGQPGPANTLSIGTVTDGEQAAASITGDAPNQQLNLTLPAGKSAYQLYVNGGGELTQEQWLASLKATIGAFIFVDYDAVAENAFTTGGIGTLYQDAIDVFEAGVNTNPSTILLMNNTNGTTPPTKTFMIATQEDSPATEQTPATYAFVYIGDLQDAMPSDIITADDLFKDSNQGSDFEIADEQGNIICQFSDGHIKTKYFDSAALFDPSRKAAYLTGSDFSTALDSNSKLTIQGLPNVRNEYVVSFYAEINNNDTFNGVIVMLDAGASATFTKAAVKIDNNNVYILQSNGTDYTQISHVLTIGGFIEVVVTPTTTHKAKLIIYTGNNGRYINDNVDWYGCGGSLSVESLTGNNLTGHYDLTISYSGFGHPLWIFGDSWCDYWPLELEKLGTKNFLLDGFGGRTSEEAYTSFLHCLEFGVPQYVVWIMGMNDPEALSDSVVQNNYKVPFDGMVLLSQQYNFKFIPCTIACGTAGQSRNELKDDYIRNSGLDFIPLAEALGCDNNGDTGYSGIMQNNQVHPTDPAGSMKVALCLSEYINNLIKS